MRSRDKEKGWLILFCTRLTERGVQEQRILVEDYPRFWSWEPKFELKTTLGEKGRLVYAMVTMSSVMSPQARGGGDLFSSPTLASPAAQALNLTLTLKTLSPNPTLLTPAMVDPNPDWTLEELQQELEALSCNYRVNRFFKFLLLLPTPQLITQLQSSITNANPAAGFWHFSSWQGFECLCDGSLSLYVMFFLQDFSLDRDI